MYFSMESTLFAVILFLVAKSLIIKLDIIFII